jgi:hypothetical protein
MVCYFTLIFFLFSTTSVRVLILTFPIALQFKSSHDIIATVRVVSVEEYVHVAPWIFVIPRCGLVRALPGVLFVGTTVIVPEFSSSIAHESEITNRFVTTIHVVTVEINRRARFLIPPGIFGVTTLPFPVFLANVFVRDLIPPRSVQVERTQSPCLAVHVVSVEIYGVPPTPIIRGCPLLEMFGLPRFSRVRHPVVELPPVMGEVAPNTVLPLGDARPTRAVVRKPDGILVLIRLVRALLDADAVDDPNVTTRAIALTLDEISRNLLVVILVPIAMMPHGEWSFAVFRATASLLPTVSMRVPRDADAIIHGIAFGLTRLKVGTSGVLEISTHAITR